ncbi:peptidase M19 [Verticiella sediminum]|uniref:Peptidase M19 n=1 Tax=Verticiella sediminum TaxID=1247510 RepID=A0A556B009_9BURK|nr:membrane dipeptidase [Verticiella sediminum]TSH98085.1 peptidase M19 [Verticiella sediminum]
MTQTSTLKYDDLIVVDSLLICNFERTILEAMHQAGITVANCTCSVWENFTETMENVARWKRVFRENADIVLHVRSVDDIHRAKREKKLGIILGWQNTSGIDDNLDFIELYAELGIRVIQLTYNTQNLVGSGCYESQDSGLTDFGRDVVGELNRQGILIDLSHVAERGANQACEWSTKPVAYTHCCPASLKAHPRNKSDAALKKVADRGGYIGCTIFPPFLPKGTASTIDDFVDVIDYMINLVGEEHVGIGTDMSQGQPWSFQEWVMHDKGNGRRLTTFGELVFPKGIERIEDFPNLMPAMQRKGWTHGRIERVLGQNWLRLLNDVWA